MTVSARPRRMSDVPDPPEPIIPIPEGSAFFILSQTNRCDTPDQSIGPKTIESKFKIIQTKK